MKVRSIQTGEIRNESDEGARSLIAAGIYEAYDEKEEEQAPVAPLTTEDLPPKPKPVKDPKPKKKSARDYKRRDMQAEK